MSMISIKGLDKAEVLAALYERAKPLGMGFLHFVPGPLPIDEARAMISEGADFDYVKGRVLKVYLGADNFNPSLFDRDNGPGSAASAIESLRAKAEAAQ